MSEDVVTTSMPIDLAFTIFVLAILCGIAVITKVPATLHTPLMSGANSIHGIVLVGAMIIAVGAERPAVATCWRSSPSRSPRSTWSAATWSPTGCSRCSGASPRRPRPTRPRRARTDRGPRPRSTPSSGSSWLAASVAFVIGLSRMNSPATARNGNLISAGGMILAIVATAVYLLFAPPTGLVQRRSAGP